MLSQKTVNRKAPAQARWRARGQSLESDGDFQDLMDERHTILMNHETAAGLVRRREAELECLAIVTQQLQQISPFLIGRKTVIHDMAKHLLG